MGERNQTTFVLTKGVKEYRATIPRYVNGNDIVLEVGCACGTTTAILSRYAKRVVGIDKGESLPIARETYPHIQFEQIDGFDIRAILDLGLRFTTRCILTSLGVATSSTLSRSSENMP